MTFVILLPSLFYLTDSTPGNIGHNQCGVPLASKCLPVGVQRGEHPGNLSVRGLGKASGLACYRITDAVTLLMTLKDSLSAFSSLFSVSVILSQRESSQFVRPYAGKIVPYLWRGG
jgi:hypothetical protein